MNVSVALLARFPVAGQCKTRLIPGYGPDGAAEIHRKLTERTVATIRASGLPFEVWGTGGTEEEFRTWLDDISYKAQPSGDLGEKLAAAATAYPRLFLGTDCPGLTAAHLQEAAQELLDGAPSVLGPAEDGGYWALGLASPCPSAFAAMPWGTEKVFELTKEKLDAANMAPILLPTLSDVDHPEDLDPWPELKP